MFESASNIVITGGSFAVAQNNTAAVEDKADEYIRLLYGNVSWNAILNSDGRAEATKCYPGTREAVMAHIEAWINGAGDDTGQRIFWLSGPAGAGKSAIAQSIAEKCLARGIPMANFFFFRADTTRNNAAPLVATLLYQLFDICPAIKRRIRDFISENFLVFGTSVEQQFKALTSPLIHRGRPWSGKHKIVLILDGLDECSSEDYSTQQDIIRTLHDIVTQKGSPFVLLVSSRAEPHLTKSFNAVQSQVSRLYLDGGSFSSSDDIRRFVIGEFTEIKKTHHLAHLLDADWPPIADIESIVSKSLGHFIYAATVMRFCQTSAESPLLNLEKAKGMRPVENTSPFAQLDAVYTHILAKAKNWLKARDILAAQILPDVQDATMHPQSSWIGTTPLAKTSYILDALGYNLHEISSYTADLTALVKVGEFGEVKFYHTSLGDFLLDKQRSLNFFIDLNKFRLKLVLALFNSFGSGMDNLSWSLIVEHFTRLKVTSDAMTKALSSSPLFSSRLAFNGNTMCTFLEKIKELYFKADADLYKSILQQWLTWFHKNHGTLQRNQLDGIQYATELWDELLSTTLPRDVVFEDTDNSEDEESTPFDSHSSTATETIVTPEMDPETFSLTPPRQAAIIVPTGQSHEVMGPATSLGTPGRVCEQIIDIVPDNQQTRRDSYIVHEQLPQTVVSVINEESSTEDTYQHFRTNRNLETRESRRRAVELYAGAEMVRVARSHEDSPTSREIVVEHREPELEDLEARMQHREEELERRGLELKIRERELDQELRRRVEELDKREQELYRREALQQREEKLLRRVEALLCREEMLVRREEELFQQRRQVFFQAHRNRASQDWTYGWLSPAQTRGET